MASRRVAVRSAGEQRADVPAGPQQRGHDPVLLALDRRHATLPGIVPLQVLVGCWRWWSFFRYQYTAAPKKYVYFQVHILTSIRISKAVLQMFRERVVPTRSILMLSV